MQWRTVILDTNNWALASSDIKEIMHWSISDQPWLVVRTFSFENPPDNYPCQLRSLNWKTAEINLNSIPDKKVKNASKLINARIKIFTELYYRIQICAENLGISNATTTLVQLYQYLISIGIIPGVSNIENKINFENRIKLLSDLEDVKIKIIKDCLLAKTEEEFINVKLLIERLLFTNILL